MMNLDAETIVNLTNLLEYAETDDALDYCDFFTDLVIMNRIVEDCLGSMSFDMPFSPEDLASEVQSLDIGSYLEYARAEVLNVLETYYL